MKRFRQMIRTCLALMALAAFLTAPLAEAEAAEGSEGYREPGATAMIIDGLVVRPVSFVATVIGGVLYVVTLPFSAMGGSAGEAGEKMVVEPAEYTFTRCLGCFREWP